jgi:hypothetical protein
MKKWYLSKTIWGVAIASLASIAGISVDENESTEIAIKAVELLGMVIAVIGRVKAKEILS